MKKRTHKRWLATLLAAAMCLSMLPAGAWVAEEETRYVQVTDVSEITSGGEFVLVAAVPGETTEYKALGTTVNSKKKLDPANVTVADGTVVGDLPIWTLASSGEGVSLFNGTHYLGYASSTNFASSSDAYTWNVTANNGAFSFTASTATRGIAYGIDQNVFGPYATSNATSTKYVFNLLVFKVVSGGDTPDPTPVKVATPTCAPASGSTVVPGTTITLSCATEGVNYRKGDSRDALVNITGNTFTLPEEDGEYTIFVQAMSADLEPSDIIELKYTVKAKLPAQKVTITQAREGTKGTEYIVTGVVTLKDGSNLYIQDVSAGICVRVSNASAFNVGDTIKAYWLLG